MEWMLARAAGYNAGFAMATSLEALKKNPNTGELLDAIRIWETCRRDHAFSQEIKSMLKDPRGVYHLEKVSALVYNLYPMIPGPPSPRTAGKSHYIRGWPIKVQIPE